MSVFWMCYEWWYEGVMKVLWRCHEGVMSGAMSVFCVCVMNCGMTVL